EGDRASGREALDQQMVFVRDVVLVDRRAKGRADAFRLDVVLVGDRQAAEERLLLLAVDRLRRLERLLGKEGDDRVQLRIDPLDLRDERADDLHRGDLSRRQQGGELACRGEDHLASTTEVSIWRSGMFQYLRSSGGVSERGTT